MAVQISSVFNRMLSAHQIEETVTESLKTWFPTYLREMERQLDLPSGTFEAPKNYSDRNAFDAEAGELTPKVVVIAPGTMGQPRKTGDGRIAVTWRVGVGIAIDAPTEQLANLRVKTYAAAIRGIMLQNSGLKDLGGADITWIEESYNDLPIPDQVQLTKAASLYFDCDISNVITRGGGPDVPDQADYAYTEVDTVDTNTSIVDVVEGG